MNEVPDFDDAVLGLGLPAEIEAALREAGALRGSDPAAAMVHLKRAQSLAPDHPAVLIALYRHHFYGHRLAAAREIARQALVVGAHALGLPPAWRSVPGRALPGAKTDPRTRFYLFVLKGYAYLSLRLDDAIEARDALVKLRELDPEDRVGGALIEAVRVRALVGDPFDDDAGPGLEAHHGPASGAAAWVRASGRPGLE